MKDDILKTELIGKHVTITQATNKTMKGITGTITNETRNMITIETSTGEKTVAKNTITFTMKHQNKTYSIDGKLLVNRPEERIKKVRTLQ